MGKIISLESKSPILGENCFLAEGSLIIGEVKTGDNCSFWFNSIVRGDVHYINIGHNVNVQDGAVIHCTYKKAPTEIGDNVSIGHNAIVHGCTIKDNVLIGMGAIVMDHAVIESNSIIAAGAIVLENTHVESGSIYGGVPAKRLKSIDEGNKEVIARTPKNYIRYANWFDPNIRVEED